MGIGYARDFEAFLNFGMPYLIRHLVFKKSMLKFVINDRKNPCIHIFS